MTKPHILYYKCLHYDQKNFEHLANLFHMHNIPDPRHDEKLSQTIKDKIEAIFLPFGFKFTAQQLSKFPKLRAIASNTTTKPDVTCEHLGHSRYVGDPENLVQVFWLSDAYFLKNITATAEHALGLMHAVHRRIPAQLINVKNNHWSRYDIKPPRKMLSKMHAVIWGYGRVGKHIAQRANPLFASVTGLEEGNSDRHINAKLAIADVLFLSMSVVSNQPVVTRNKLERLPEHAIVVNVARGEVLDHDALFHLIHQEHLDGAGLDVLPRDHTYQFGETDPAYEHAKVLAKNTPALIITPHIAGSTCDAWHDTQRYVIDKVKEVLL